jgi:hypothetical protein
VEILTLLCVDQESESLRVKSSRTLAQLLSFIRRQDGPDPAKISLWVVELAHIKLFQVSKALADPIYGDNLLHEENRLEQHLATMHGFLFLLKQIEDSRQDKLMNAVIFI